MKLLPVLYPQLHEQKCVIVSSFITALGGVSGWGGGGGTESILFVGQYVAYSTSHG
jgi:hypothetical protein